MNHIELKLMKSEEVKFNFQLAVYVAKMDRDVGVSSAIEELEKIGFDCSYYFNTMNNIEDSQDVDFDKINLETRDKLFEMLGIKKLMDQAYELVWR